MQQHPAHTDLRYLIAYSRLSRFAFNLALTLGVVLLVVNLFQSPSSGSFIESIVLLAFFGVPLFIALLRLAL